MTENLAPIGGKYDRLTELDDLEQRDLFTIEEVAELMRVSPRAVQRWISKGHLKAFREGGTLRVQRFDLLQLNNHHKETNSS